MKRKQILFIARWYPDRHDNMLGLFVQKHAQAVQLIHDVSVLYVTADPTLDSGKSRIDKSTHEGINEIKIYFGKSTSEVVNAFRYLKWYLHGMKLLPRPDLIHVHILTRAGIPALWSKITRGTPYIITEHWSRYLPVNLSRGSYTGFLRKAATQMVVKNAGAVTTVTSNLAEAMQKLGLTSRYHVTPNVVDISQFTPETSGMQGIKKLIHVSCFDEAAKNIKGIIDATATLASRRRDFILEIIGSGKDFNEVHDHAVKTGLEGTVIQFRGLLEGEPLISAMRDSDALVMFSNYENLPCTIVESLAVGVPVISTDVGGIKEHLKPEFGTLIKTGDTPALVSAMNDILDGKITFDHRSMRRYAESHFSFSEIGNQFNRIYFEAGMKPD